MNTKELWEQARAARIAAEVEETRIAMLVAAFVAREPLPEYAAAQVRAKISEAVANRAAAEEAESKAAMAHLMFDEMKPNP